MAKFIKSIFYTTDRRKNSKHEEGDEEKVTNALPLDGRRKLSISRSGRMKHSNRKRHSLSLELYNQEIQMTEKRKSVEYQTNQKPIVKEMQTTNMQRSCTPPLKTPEEEIDRAFEIIEKI
ncbi:uncharacterized protein LOC123665092 [Melitaea cinxia]|uniref:uncharacterized protein LOC123665092 n=1 Tax=Melitaea cinxia TaxID=113334 RepID=UPI0004EA460B|nr:uncharacterized protein LOC123665092 [Melitaea cinxia]